MAKTNWQHHEIVTESDLNQLGQEINEKETLTGSQQRAAEAVDTAKAYTDQQITLVTETGIPKLNVYEYQIDGEIGATEFTISLETFDHSTDTVKLYINTTFKDRSDFTIVNAVFDEGTLVSHGKVVLNNPLTVNSKVVIEIWKNIPIGEEGSISGQVIAPNSLPQNRVAGLAESLGGLRDDITSHLAEDATDAHRAKNITLENGQTVEDAISNPEYSAATLATRSVIPLSNAEYGKLVYKLFGRTYVNLVGNGNFSNGTTGWGTSRSTITATNNVLTFTGNGAGATPLIYQGLRYQIVEGKRYFIRAKVRVLDEANSIRVLLIGTDTGGSIGPAAQITSPIINQWYTLTNVVTILPGRSGALNAGIQSIYPDATAASGKRTEVAEVMYLDLDQYPHLAGLTADEINAQIPGYVDGMQSVDNLKIVSVGKNLFDGELENGTINSSTGLPIAFADRKRTTFIPILPNTNYAVDSTASAFLYDTNKQYIVGHFEVTSFNSSGASFVRLASTTANMNALSRLEQGTTPTPYEPYQESAIYLNEPLRSLPNGVRDEIDSEGNLIRRVGEVVLVGSDFTALNTSGINRDYVTVAISKFSNIRDYGLDDPYGVKAITNVSIPRQAVTADSVSNSWRHGFSPNFLIIYIPKGTYANLAAAQAALAGTVVQYELATPVVEKVSIPPLSSFKDGTLSFGNKRKYLLQAEDVTVAWTNYTNVDLARVPVSVFKDYISPGISQNGIIKINGMIEQLTASGADSVSNIGKYSTALNNQGLWLDFIVPKGTTLQQAREQLAGLEIEYETIPFPLPQVEYSYPANLAAGAKGNTEMIAQLGRELGGLWTSLLPLADKELAMGLVAPAATSTGTDLQAKINEILSIWT